MATPYGGSRTRGGTPYGSGSRARVTAPKPKPKKKGPSLGGFLGNVGEGLKDLAVGSGVGVAALAKNAWEGGYTWEGTKDVGRAVAKDFEERYGPLARGDLGEFAHQLYEQPVPFALDVGAVVTAGAGTAARGAALGKAAKTGGSVRRALRHGPEPELRYVKNPDTDAKVLLGTYSRSALTRRTQKFLDGIRQTFPERGIMGRSLYRKIGFQQNRLGEIEERLGRAAAGELAAVGKKLTNAEHRALRVVGEGVPLDVRIARHRADLAAATGKQRKRLNREIELLEKVRPLLDDSGGFADPKLAAVYDLVTASATRREDILAAVDELAPEKAAARTRKPAELFGEGEGETFFSYSSRKRPTTFARLGASQRVRHPRKPGTTQEFTGEAITQGRVPKQEALLAAEAELEAFRYSTILRNRDRLEELAKPVPTKPTDVALVLDELRGKRLPEEVQAFLDKSATGEVLAPEQIDVLARISQGIREQIFPGQWKDLQRLDAFREAAENGVPGVVWVDERLLGGLHSTNPIMAGFAGNQAARRIFAGVDAVNNATKAALLYLLPLKYISPNLISQAGFSLIQQGFAAPRQLGRAATMNASLGRKMTQAIDAGMGEGFAASIAGDAPGGLQRLAQLNRAASNVYGKVIDLPFRRAAFLHEAEHAGFRTAKQIEDLLFNPELRDRRLATFLEANSEIIDYARLGRFERNIIRRVVFFYPWVKGATVYGPRFLGEHPVKAFVLDQIGKLGTEIQAEALGELLPSYAEALAPIGESGGLPTTLNLGSVTPFTTPYQVFRGLTGDRRGAYAIGNQFSPALSAGIMATGYTPPGGYESGYGAALRELYEGLPQVRYPQRLIEGTEGRVYPTTTTEDILSLIFGTGVTPRRTDPKRLAEEAKRGR